MVRTLGMQAQQHDQISKEAQSRFMLLWQAMTNPPLLIECEITTLQRTNYKEIKYDEFNLEVANHILENYEKLLEVNINRKNECLLQIVSKIHIN